MFKFMAIGVLLLLALAYLVPIVINAARRSSKRMGEALQDEDDES